MIPDIINSFLNFKLNEIKNTIKNETEQINNRLDRIENEIQKLPTKLQNKNITPSIYYGLRNKFVKGSNGRFKEVFEDENGILYIKLNRKQTEEIINENTTEILYKGSKCGKVKSIKINS